MHSLLRETKGPRPTEYLTIETREALLVGEKIAGQWRWSCEEFPFLVHDFGNCVNPEPCIKRFFRLCRGER